MEIENKFTHTHAHTQLTYCIINEWLDCMLYDVFIDLFFKDIHVINFMWYILIIY